MLDEKTLELIAIGATITANCQPCLDFHVGKARELGVQEAAIAAAIEVGQEVRGGAVARMDRFAAGMIGAQTARRAGGGCDCG